MNPNLTFNSNLVLNGNLTVTGNVTAVQSTTTQITDPLLTLGLGNAGTSYDLGLVLIRGSGGNRFIGFKENEGAFVFINTTEDGLTTGNIATTAYSNVIFGNAVTLGSSTFGGITLSGNTISAAGILTVRSDAGTVTIPNAAVVTGATILSSTLSVAGATTVDSLRSNAGIIATTGSFSSTLTAQDLVVNASSTLNAASITTTLVTGGTATVNALVSNTTLTAASGTILGNLLVEGNLAVLGNVSYINVDTFIVEDPIIQLNTGPNGAPLSIDNNFDSGVSTNYFDTADRRTFFGRKDSSGFFEYFSNVTGESGNVITGTYGTIKSGNLELVSAATVGTTLTANAGIQATAIGNVTTSTAAFTTLTSSGLTTFTDATDSTGATSGAVVITGGLAVGKDLNVTTEANIGNVTINNLTITSNTTNQGLNINPNGTGVTTINSGLNTSRTVINGTAANTFVVSGTQVGVNTSSFISGATFQINAVDTMLLPVGAIGDRPVSPVAGMLRFSTSQGSIEWYNGSAWAIPTGDFTVVVANSQTGDNSQTIFTLPVANASTAGTIVSINGVVQQPTSAYSITGANVTFTEAPASTDVIDFRVFTTTSQVTEVVDIAGTTGLFLDLPAANSKIITFKTFGTESFSVQANSTARFTGNVEPSANITYSLGSTTNRWKDLWLSGSTIYLGNIQIQNTTGNTVSFVTSTGAPASLDVDISDPSGIQATPIGNATPASGNFTTVDATGNISASFFTGNGRLLTGIDATSIQNGTSNVKVYTNGAISTGVAGSNVFVVSSFGANVTGTLGVGSMTLTSNVIMTSGDTIYLDPGSDAGGQGTVIVNGNLVVTGNTTTINAQTLTISDKDIFVANNATTAAEIDGAGIHAGNVNGVGIARWIYNNATSSWQSNVGITPSANASFSMGGTSNYWSTGYFNAIQSPSITGILQTAAQPNITSVGTLTSVTVSGAITVNSANGVTAIVNGGTSGTGNIGATGATFNTVFAKATTAQYADLAENYAGDAVYEPGTVVHFGGSQEVTLCDEDMCRRVAGVVSTNPAYLMNSHLQGIATAVALQGRVPCKVQGTVRLGDMMVSAGNGFARAEADPTLGSVIGKALADFDGIEGVIEVVVGRV